MMLNDDRRCETLCDRPGNSSTNKKLIRPLTRIADQVTDAGSMVIQGSDGEESQSTPTYRFNEVHTLSSPNLVLQSRLGIRYDGEASGLSGPNCVLGQIRKRGEGYEHT